MLMSKNWWQRIAIEIKEDFNNDADEVQVVAQNARLHGDIGVGAMVHYKALILQNH